MIMLLGEEVFEVFVKYTLGMYTGFFSWNGGSFSKARFNVNIVAF